jgi:hypothetical protein
VLALALIVGCAKAPPTLTPVGKTAWQGIQAIRVLDTIRDVAIAANAQTPPILSTDTTRKVVTFHKSAVTVIGASPGGWKPIVTASIGQLQKDVPAAEWTKIAPYVALLSTIIQEIP